MSGPAFFWLMVGSAIVLIAATEGLRAAGYKNAPEMVILAAIGSALAFVVVRPGE